MSIKPKRTIHKKLSQKEIQKKVQQLSVDWDFANPEKNLKKLKQISRELESQISKKTADKVWGTNKAYKVEDIQAARKWFRDEVKRLMGTSEVNHKRMSKYTRRQKPMSMPVPTDIGKMFFYKYDPKHKKTLPYYDVFPLILMVGSLKDGWHGLNLHYLPPKQREILIWRLMETLTDTNLDDKTRLKISYGLLKGVSKYRYFKPCFKRYLVNHVTSSVRPIPIRHWTKAILLPVANFKKASISTVWADSKRKMRG